MRPFAQFVSDIDIGKRSGNAARSVWSRRKRCECGRSRLSGSRIRSASRGRLCERSERSSSVAAAARRSSLHPDRSGRHKSREGQVGAGRGIGRAKLEIELPGPGIGLARADRADADRGLAILGAQVVECSAPAMRHESQRRNAGGRRQGRDSVEVPQNARDEGRCVVRQPSCPSASWVTGRPSAVQRLRWICTPLPTTSGPTSGVKVAAQSPSPPRWRE